MRTLLSNREMKLILFFLLCLFCCDEKLKKPEQEKKDTNQSEPVYEYNSYLVKAKSGLRMRKSPDTNAEVIQSIPQNAIVFKVGDTKIIEELEGKQGTWVKVDYKFKTGYVFSGFLDKNTTKRNLLDSIFITESELFFPDDYDAKRMDFTRMISSSYDFIFAPPIHSKIYFYPFTKKIKAPIELKVKSVKFVEREGSGDSVLEFGFLKGAKGEVARFEIDFEDFKDEKTIQYLSKEKQKFLFGLMLYPPPKSFSCLRKTLLDGVELPKDLTYLEFAIDLNNDDKPDILKYNIVTDDSDERISFLKNDSDQWIVYQKFFSKNYGFDESKNGFYPTQYLCDSSE